MGEQLKKTALSTNVKERTDYSCCLLDPKGRLIANAPHIPVHLGAMGLCVRQVKEAVSMKPGDVILTNHPAYGGSHLPDLTVIMPVFDDQGDVLLGYLANRAHHAEIGGIPRLHATQRKLFGRRRCHHPAHAPLPCGGIP